MSAVKTSGSFAEKFPECTHYIDGVELHTFAPGRAVMWCSDWTRIESLPGLRRVFGGPATYGDVAFYIENES